MPNEDKPPAPKRDIASERASMTGALEALNALHADLTLRREEARDAAAREVYDEVLTVLASLESEYGRMHAALPPVAAAHASYVFLLDEQGGVHPLPHSLYVALVRNEAAAPDFAGRTLRLTEWYVRLERGEPETVVNENYGLIKFDEEGRVDWAATPAFHTHRSDAVTVPESAALPSVAERERIRARLFGATPGAGSADWSQGGI